MKRGQWLFHRLRCLTGWWGDPAGHTTLSREGEDLLENCLDIWLWWDALEQRDRLTRHKSNHGGDSLNAERPNQLWSVVTAGCAKHKSSRVGLNERPEGGGELAAINLEDYRNTLGELD
jgi:hypothetical protein